MTAMDCIGYNTINNFQIILLGMENSEKQSLTHNQERHPIFRATHTHTHTQLDFFSNLKSAEERKT